MKNILPFLILAAVDAFSVVLSSYIASEICDTSDVLNIFGKNFYISISFIIVFFFMIDGLYNKRYDFWQESRVVIKNVFLSFLVTYLIFVQTNEISIKSSKNAIFLSFFISIIFILFSKRIAKISMTKSGIWLREIDIYPATDDKLSKEIYGNPYFGFIKPKKMNCDSLIINSSYLDFNQLKDFIEKNLSNKKEILFVPYLNDFDLTHSKIFDLTNARSNLICLENRLNSRTRVFVKRLLDNLIAISIFPLLVPIILVISFLIYREDPNGRIIFRQTRLGKDAKLFTCYKFRTMYEDSENILKEYISSHPEEKTYYQLHHKYKEDPRVTKIGRFLRSTSLDELPQIINVFKQEMSIVGPRPYMLSERKELGKYEKMILSVMPGITGLWQVSGRNDLRFSERIEIDVWYIRNWNLWLDWTILLKTLKVLYTRQGAR